MYFWQESRDTYRERFLKVLKVGGIFAYLNANKNLVTRERWRQQLKKEVSVAEVS